MRLPSGVSFDYADNGLRAAELPSIADSNRTESNDSGEAKSYRFRNQSVIAGPDLRPDWPSLWFPKGEANQKIAYPSGIAR